MKRISENAWLHWVRWGWATLSGLIVAQTVGWGHSIVYQVAFGILAFALWAFVVGLLRER